MVFFSIKSILRLFIKACTIFSFLLLIVLCFFLIFSNCNSVSAFTFDVPSNNVHKHFYIPDNFYDFIKESDYYNDNYNFLAWAFWYNGSPHWNVLFASASFGQIANYDASTGHMIFNTSITSWYRSIDNVDMNSNNFSAITSHTGNLGDGGWLGQSNVQYPYYDGTLCFYFGSANGALYNNNVIFPSFMTIPTIENFQNANVITSMEHGEYFDIIINSNDYYEDDIIFNMNNGDLELDAEGQNISFVLNENSPYLLPHIGNYLSWKIPKADLIPIYNNCTYNFSLTYGPNGSLSTIVESLTTDFSALGLEMANVDTQDATQKTADELSEMNDFLKDDSFDNNSIINDMPNSDEYTDPADGGLLTIFTALENAFTDDSNTPVRFYIPFTDNKYIDLPPDLTSSHVPQVILTIVQGLYWYIICRYIVKDISKTANKAKSGELLDSKDGNIRTDLL